MEYRRLGNSGLKVSELSFGSWVTFVNQLDKKSAMDCMQYAYDKGVNFFDNAEAYASGESEILMGKILKKLNRKKHYLISSVCSSKNGSMIWNYTDKAALTMKKMSEDEIKEYLNKIVMKHYLHIMYIKLKVTVDHYF